MAALTEQDEVLMVRQYRYALKEELWELPAGKLEKDEDPFEAAKRELEEECGVTAERFINLGVLYRLWAMTARKFISGRPRA